jgi:NhaP-type Na+/H+ or K+/H+ antiporter
VVRHLELGEDDRPRREHRNLRTMDQNEIFLGFGTILVFGIVAQWVGRRSGIPSLLLLLPAGLLAGDVLNLVDPVALFGDLLFPLVSLLLSLLLFQAGLQLRLRSLPHEVRSSVARLVGVGMTMTFVGASLAAGLFLNVPMELAFMTGAILVVSGPTVVGPLLEVIRPIEPAGTILRWEGTILDPIGAILGVVVLNLILAGGREGVHPILQMLGRLGLGAAIGLAAAGLLILVMSNFLLTDNMEASVALMFAVLAFTTAELLLSEAGLVATLTVGVVIANQRFVTIDRITGFGDTLDVLIIGTLFILLAALVDISESLTYLLPTAALTAVLILVVRPVSTAVSLVGTPVPNRQRALIAWMDPRGIVAAAIAAQFSVTLSADGFDADFLLPVVFGVILGTGVVYGLTGKPMANLLGVAQPKPAGIGLLGDDPWLVPFGRCLAGAGVSTLLITNARRTFDPNPLGDQAAALTNVSIQDGTDVVEQAMCDAELADLVVSFRPGEVHSWIISSAIELLGRRHILRVPDEQTGGVSAVVPDWWSNKLFDGKVTKTELERAFADGATIEVVSTPPGPGATLLVSVSSHGRVDFKPQSKDARPTDTLIGLVKKSSSDSQDR